MKTQLETKLVEFVLNPYNLEINLDLGYLYEEENQLASAISHYLRGAEYGLDNITAHKRKYITECLLRAATCMEKLGNRHISVKSLILNALSYFPNLPQVHLQLSKCYEISGEWLECNAYSSLGLTFFNCYDDFKYDDKTKDDILNELLFQRAVSNYHIGKFEKSKIEFVRLQSKTNLKTWMRDAIERSLNTTGLPSSFDQINYD